MVPFQALQAVGHGVLVMMNNTGQSCNAPSRMLVPRRLLAEAEAKLRKTDASLLVSPP